MLIRADIRQIVRPVSQKTKMWGSYGNVTGGLAGFRGLCQGRANDSALQASEGCVSRYFLQLHKTWVDVCLQKWRRGCFTTCSTTAVNLVILHTIIHSSFVYSLVCLFVRNTWNRVPINRSTEKLIQRINMRHEISGWLSIPFPGAYRPTINFTH